MIALVTGGAGFIGSHLVEALVAKGFKVRVLDSLVKGKLDSIVGLVDCGAVEFFEGDIRCRDAVDRAVAGSDLVFHTAAVHIKRCVDSPQEAVDVNVSGSYNVFRSCLDNGVKRVVFSSSSSVYGNPLKLPMSEDSELRVSEPYGASKLMGEHLLRFLGGGKLEFSILRYFNVYGKRQADHAYYTTVVTEFVRRLLSGRKPVIDGDGSQSMDFTHVSDVVRGNILAATDKHCNDVFNIGTGVSTSVGGLAEILVRALGLNCKPVFRPRQVFVSRRQADIRKARAFLGFRPQVGIEEGLKRLALDMREETRSKIVEAESK